MKFNWAVLALSVTATAAAARLEKRASKPTATINQGVVIGTTTTYAGSTSKATKYVGIPFAKSPPLRFAPPEKAPSFSQPYMATSTKPACLQSFTYPKAVQQREKSVFNNPGGQPPVESEDCLYLNVYIPPKTKQADKKAVLFWIYGGNLQFGSGTLDPYDGSNLAIQEDVIVVTHNYRTNVFGYPSAPEIASPHQNVGFLDQRQALQWVQDNIAAFGGDPSKVTIFGESAGGYSVKQLLALPPSPMPFRSAILESEAATLGNGTQSWITLSTLLGCSTVESSIKCLRQKKASKIKHTIEKNVLSFPPVLNNITAVSDIRPLIESGQFAKVPFLIGTNADEGRAFTYVAGLDQPTNISIKTFRAFLGTFIPSQAVVNGLIGALNLGESVSFETASDVLTKLAFQCPASQVASLATQNGYEVWRYFYNASFPNEAVFPDAGAFHSSEIPQVFGTYPRSNALGNATPAQIKLSAFMSSAWAQFAKDPYDGPGWAPLGAAGRVESLGYPKKTGGSLVSAEQLDAACAIYDPIIALEGL